MLLGFPQAIRTGASEKVKKKLDAQSRTISSCFSASFAAGLGRRRGLPITSSTSTSNGFAGDEDVPCWNVGSGGVRAKPPGSAGKRLAVEASLDTARTSACATGTFRAACRRPLPRPSGGGGGCRLRRALLPWSRLRGGRRCVGFGTSGRAELPAVKSFLDVLQRATLRRKLEVLAGYDTSQTGALVA